MTTHADIMTLERQFWQAMQDMDMETAVSLLDSPSITVAARGVVRFAPDQYRAMAQSGNGRITAFAFFDEQVIFPAPDVAVAAYGAMQAFTVNGEHHDMVVYDTTTWVRKNGRWLACAHTETPEKAGRPR
ncbi:nuclear transport factor 2 family protein [Xanthomonas sp. XNM01]|uniref:nuclear transport factor 2 family protein n=1 Tax=Xanthomonas sp. XNM01 TaxID=2769289 RepID=UPI001780CE27|nr:nuclear transport factor 2 family protein [Xanthomonas sp. XNM01]MBD9370386.1 nuclear transport factor 2 family protein [Xanthomonas sp. XNM01]